MVHAPVKLISVFALLLTTICKVSAQQGSSNQTTAELIRVIDGAHIVARVALSNNKHKNLTIRLMGIDAPKINGACIRERLLAQHAKNRLESILTKNLILSELFEVDNELTFMAQVKTSRGADPASLLTSEKLVRPYWGGHVFGWCNDQTTCLIETCRNYDESKTSE